MCKGNLSNKNRDGGEILLRNFKLYWSQESHCYSSDAWLTSFSFGTTDWKTYLNFNVLRFLGSHAFDRLESWDMSYQDLRMINGSSKSCCFQLQGPLMAGFVIELKALKGLRSLANPKAFFRVLKLIVFLETILMNWQNSNKHSLTGKVLTHSHSSIYWSFTKYLKLIQFMENLCLESAYFNLVLLEIWEGTTSVTSV